MEKTINRIRSADFPKLLKTEGIHNDGGSLRLIVRGGSARWEYQYKENGETISAWLGSAVGYAPMSLAQAREARTKAWLERRGNGIPRKARAVTAGKTFAQGLEMWLDANPNQWTDKSVRARRVLAESSLATLDIGKITSADVLSALTNETPRQHADKRGWLAQFFAYAKAQQWRAGDNPAQFDTDMRRGFAKVSKGDKHHVALPYADLPGVYKALPESDVGKAVRFTILTAARAGEVEKAKWSQIVPDNGHGTAWEYTVLKGNKPFAHRVPLTAEALALLGPKGAPDAPLFTLPANAMLNTLQAERADATMHGLRSTFKQWCDDNAVANELSEAALSHYRGDAVHRAYSRGDLFVRRRKVMEEWAAFVTR